MSFSFSAACCLLFLQLSAGYRHFQDQIPNGNRVPHPCKPNELWDGVGHFNEQGGGNRNPFGQDFEAEGKIWTEALCRKDSDGDGKTNGQELGDPECTWRSGEVPKLDFSLSHPGVCEPLDSETCQQRQFDKVVYRVQEEWMADACKRDEFVCPALNEEGVQNVTFKFPKTAVPAKETTYMCAVFDVPDPDSDVHLIATTPLIDNRQVMHHILLYGCFGEVDRNRSDPYECDMDAGVNCNTLLSAWTLGVNGDCAHGNSGIRLGHYGFKTLALQFHWNNPEESSAYEDGSGMVLYYTPNRRVFDGSIMWLGNDRFQIPPRQPLVTVEGRCGGACTRDGIVGKIYITKAVNHMHYLGTAQSVAHYRNGQLLRYITNEEIYSYDSPKIYDFSTPIEVLPGDELKTVCKFNSMTRAKTTEYGESTQEEMCFAFLAYYPAENFAVTNKWCVSTLTYTPCDPESRNGCDGGAFVESLETYLFEMITKNCTYHGLCRQECKDAIKEARQREPCLRRENKELFVEITEDYMGVNATAVAHFLGCLSSCDLELYKEELEAERKEGQGRSTEGPSGNQDSTGAADALKPGAVLMTLALILFIMNMF